jgi:hypothetical protein|tara:strand:- start:340 stop:522 length:183 start_codon:yes stop_codon:yes gene_type:complete
MFFDNDAQYTLLDAKPAHQIQSEMALAFFDLNIKGEASSLEVLRENPWKEYKAKLEILGY